MRTPGPRLHQHRERLRRLRPQRAACTRAAIRRRDQSDHRDFDIAVVGDFPNGKRVPRIGDNGHPRLAEPAHAGGRSRRRRWRMSNADHPEPHRESRFRRCASPQGRTPAHRGIRGQRVVGAVDPRVDRGITQRREHRVGRNIGIRIDPGRLHAAVPDVAIESVEQERSSPTSDRRIASPAAKTMNSAARPSMRGASAAAAMVRKSGHRGGRDGTPGCAVRMMHGPAATNASIVAPSAQNATNVPVFRAIPEADCVTARSPNAQRCDSQNACASQTPSCLSIHAQRLGRGLGAQAPR